MITLGVFLGPIRDFSINILLLFGMVLLYQISRYRPKQKGWFKNIFVGFIVGFIGVLTMTFPFTLQPGLIFDSRSVLFLISGYFFGPVVTFVGAIVGGAYRIFIGGSGVYAGVGSIIATSLVGISWDRIEARLPKTWPVAFNFYLMGFIAHIITVLCQLLIVPFPSALDAIRVIAIPFLVIYPIATLVLALSINNNKKRLLAEEAILSQKLLLQSSIDAAQNIEIYALDTNYKYLTFNEYHAYSMDTYYGKIPSIGDNFLLFVEADAFRKRLKSEIDLALNGQSHVTEAEIEVSPGKYYESHYNPIIDSNHQIIGVSVFAQEVTQRINDAKQILHLSYHDSLTGLKNRRFYQEEIERLEEDPSRTLTFVLFDINGLKIMNDAFGHHTGDLLLKNVTNIIKDNLPEQSSFMRIGGDEFVIIFYDMGEHASRAIIDKVDDLVRSETINGIHFSVSFGVEEHHHDETIVDSIRRAEKKMYTKKLSEVTSSRHETIRAILNTLHIKNKREESHSARVALICQKLGEALHLRREEIDLIKVMANLHDIGKIAIDDAILNKPGKLNEHEWSEIKKHPETGYHILLASPEYAEIAEDILSHHERWDGKGYPRGLKGQNIPYRARIIAIADSYDAMTSERPYRQAMTKQQALQEIKNNAGTQFDPKIARIFVDHVEKDLIQI